MNRNAIRISKSYILLPAYNEAKALAQLVPRIVLDMNSAQRPFEIIVINDGSSDDTSRLISTFPAAYATRELRHETNTGYGFALKTGFLWVIKHAQGEEAAVTLDADNTQDPAYIPRMLTKLEEGFGVVTASYTMEGGRSSGVPWMRRLMSTLLNALFRQVISLPGVRTYTNGFRAYRVSGLQAAHHKYQEDVITDPGFPGGTELFIKIAGLGGEVAEIPFDLHYENRGGASKIRLGRTISRYLTLLWQGRRYAPSSSPLMRV